MSRLEALLDEITEHLDAVRRLACEMEFLMPIQSPAHYHMWEHYYEIKRALDKAKTEAMIETMRTIREGEKP